MGDRIVPPNRAPVIDSDSVFIGSGHELVALDKETGEMTWTLEVMTAYSVPALANGAIVMADVNGCVFAEW